MIFDPSPVQNPRWDRKRGRTFKYPILHDYLHPFLAYRFMIERIAGLVPFANTSDAVFA